MKTKQEKTRKHKKQHKQKEVYEKKDYTCKYMKPRSDLTPTDPGYVIDLVVIVFSSPSFVAFSSFRSFLGFLLEIYLGKRIWRIVHLEFVALLVWLWFSFSILLSLDLPVSFRHSSAILNRLFFQSLSNILGEVSKVVLENDLPAASGLPPMNGDPTIFPLARAMPIAAPEFKTGSHPIGEVHLLCIHPSRQIRHVKGHPQVDQLTLRLELAGSSAQLLALLVMQRLGLCLRFGRGLRP